MAKLIAILNVVAWAGFWSFGFLAVTTPTDEPWRMVASVMLAAFGGAAGLWAWFWIVRHSEEIGYAKPSASKSRPDGEEEALGA